MVSIPGFGKKRGPGRPPKSEAPYDMERREDTLAFWNGLAEMMNSRHAAGYRLEHLYRIGGNEVIVVWCKREVPHMLVPGTFGAERIEA